MSDGECQNPTMSVGVLGQMEAGGGHNVTCYQEFLEHSNTSGKWQYCKKHLPY